MKWEDFKKQELDFSFTDLKETNIECPVCGKKIFKRMNVVLTTYPPQYQYECKCGWVGYAHF